MADCYDNFFSNFSTNFKANFNTGASASADGVAVYLGAGGYYIGNVSNTAGVLFSDSTIGKVFLIARQIESYVVSQGVLFSKDSNGHVIFDDSTAFNNTVQLAFGAAITLLVPGPMGAFAGIFGTYATGVLLGTLFQTAFDASTRYPCIPTQEKRQSPFHQPPPNPGDPLVLDLAGTGITLTSLADSNASFDFDSTGFAEKTGWITAGEGLLVLPPSGATSLSGSDLLGATSGNAFADLASLDSNEDGIIDSSDAAYQQLRVWIDSNGDGSLQSGELYTLQELGIASIDVTPIAVGTSQNGNVIISQASFSLTDGTSHTIAEANFAVSRSQTTYVPPASFEFDFDTMYLPEIAAYGFVPDLRTAMSLDNDLLVEATDLVVNAGSMTYGDFRASFENLLFGWTKVIDVDPDSRGPYVNAQHLAVVYDFYGIDQENNSSYAVNPNKFSGAKWELAYNEIIDELEIRFVSQIATSRQLLDSGSEATDAFSAFQAINYDPFSDILTVNLPDLLSAILSNVPSDPSLFDQYIQVSFSLVGDLRVDLADDSKAAIVAGVIGGLNRLGANANIIDAALTTFGVPYVCLSPTGIYQELPSDAVIVLGVSDSLVQGSNEAYAVGVNAGNTVISDEGGSAALVLQMEAADVTISRVGDDLVVEINATGKSVTVADQFGSSGFGVDQIDFADGTKLDGPNIAAAAWIRPTAQNKPDQNGYVTISVNDDYYLTVTAGSQDEIINLGDGSNGDTSGFLASGAEATAGDMDSSSTQVTNAPLGDSDTGIPLSFAATASGSTQKGNEDEVVYSVIDGNLIINAHTDIFRYEPNHFLFLEDLAFSDVKLTRELDDLIVTISSTGKTIRVVNEFALVGGYGGVPDYSGIGTLVFEDGTGIGRAAILALSPVEAGDGDTTINIPSDAQAGLDIILGAGADVVNLAGLSSDAANIHYDLKDGDTIINEDVASYRSAPRNVLILDDLLVSDIVLSRVDNNLLIAVVATGHSVTVSNEFESANEGISQLVLADGTVLGRSVIEALSWFRAGPNDATVTTPYNDYLGYAPTLQAGPGNDVFAPDQYGSDTYLYAKADGNLEIDKNVASYRPAVFDTLSFTDLDASDLTLTRSGNDLQIGIDATGKVITVAGEFNSTDHDGVQQIDFADGTTLNRNQIEAQAWFRAGPNDATVTTPYNGYLGYAPTLQAGPGNDVFAPDQYGSDTYLYAKADGNLEIDKNVASYRPAVFDTLSFTDLDASDVTLTRSGNDLQIGIDATGKVITVAEEFNSTDHDGVQQIDFADGTTLNRNQIEAQATETITFGASSTSQNLSNLGDIPANIYFDQQNDTLTTGQGAAAFFYSAADGYAQIFDAQPQTDVLKLTDLNASDVSLSMAASPYVDQAATDLQVTIKATGKVIDVYSQFSTQGNGIGSSGVQGIGSIEFADGTALTAAQIQAEASANATTNPLAILQSGNDNPLYDIGGADVDVVSTANADGNYRLRGATKLTVDIYPGIGGNQATLYPDGDGDLQCGIIRLHDVLASDVVASIHPNSDNDVVLTNLVTGDTFNLGHEGDANFSAFDTVVFDDGTTWSRSYLLSNLVSVIENGETTNYNASSAGTTVYTSLGGGTANISGSGGTTIDYAQADGNLVIQDKASVGTPSDILAFSDLALGDVTIQQSGVDALIQVKATGAVVSLLGQYGSHGSGISTIQFSDGSTLDVTSPALAMITTDTSTQNTGAIVYNLGAGNHQAVSLFHDDPAIIDWASGDGNETFTVESNNDTNDAVLDLTDLVSSQVSLERDGDDLVVENLATGKSITFTDGADPTHDDVGVSQIVFADGGSVSHATIEALDSTGANSTSNTPGIVYDLGLGDHPTVSLNHDDPSTVVWDAADGNESFAIEGNGYSNDGTLRITGLTHSDVTTADVGNDLVVTNDLTGKAVTIENENNGLGAASRKSCSTMEQSSDTRPCPHRIRLSSSAAVHRS